jgi:uncharacterized protein (DUF362 family)
MVCQALELLKADLIFSSNDKILLKPNYVAPRDPSTGITTDSRVIEGIVEFLKNKRLEDITIGDGGSPFTDKTFELTGIREVALQHGLKLVNFNKDTVINVKIPSARVLHEVPLARTALESTSIINVPTLKIHHIVKATLSIKNLMGLIVGNRGALMHRQIEEKIVDLATLIRPKLNIIDGIVGSEMDETLGRPVKMNLIIAGMDPVATDAVGCAVMGLNPQTVTYLQLAQERSIGIADLQKIDVLGEPIKTIARSFDRSFAEKRLRRYGFSNVKVSEKKVRHLWENMYG